MCVKLGHAVSPPIYLSFRFPWTPSWFKEPKKNIRGFSSSSDLDFQLFDHEPLFETKGYNGVGFPWLLEYHNHISYAGHREAIQIDVGRSLEAPEGTASEHNADPFALSDITRETPCRCGGTHQNGVRKRINTFLLDACLKIRCTLASNRHDIIASICF